MGKLKHIIDGRGDPFEVATYDGHIKPMLEAFESNTSVKVYVNPKREPVNDPSFVNMDGIETDRNRAHSFKPYCTDIKDKLIWSCENGLTVAETAKYCGISHVKIQGYVNKYNLTSLWKKRNLIRKGRKVEGEK